MHKWKKDGHIVSKIEKCLFLQTRKLKFKKLKREDIKAVEEAKKDVEKIILG